MQPFEPIIKQNTNNSSDNNDLESKLLSEPNQSTNDVDIKELW